MIKAFVKQLTLPATPPSNSDWTATDPWLRFGNRTVVGLVGGLFLFSLIVSISGAVIAIGKVTVEGNYQSVQHPDGGIVTAIHVRNGDLVGDGQPLVSLDSTDARANLEIVSARVRELSLQVARLIAERDGSGSFALPPGLDANDPAVSQTRAAQQALFDARMAAFKGEQGMLGERLKQVEDEVSGLEAQLTARSSEREIIERELADIVPLFERGYVNRARLSPLQRESARLTGELGRLKSELAKLDSTLAETRLRKAQSEKQFMREVVDELGKVQAQLSEQRETQKKYAEILERTQIRAPRAGRVHSLAAHTIGGVITPASQIALIIPQSDRLIVSAQLVPADIDRVRTGHKADVLFPSFNARMTPRLKGLVARVSPAEEKDEQGRTYFTAEIDIPADEIARIGADHPLIPGMPAEVFIETSYRSILSYLVKPLTDAMGHAFRER
ncbi:MAG: HlyD family type I secretion periplasmic adaptor subunit [Alphaproteobacteria bacterium]|nr:HlyD family type I secretion periplasmic adaptor subunit [Alphaproteobacteria bacterium]